MTVFLMRICLQELKAAKKLFGAEGERMVKEAKGEWAETSMAEKRNYRAAFEASASRFVWSFGSGWGD